MKKVVMSCSGAKHIIKKIVKELKVEYSELQVKKFPDNEISIRFLKNLKNKELILIQSFYGDISQKIIETLFAIYTAKDLGAKKITLVALYFPYFRKDKRFQTGECISIKIIGRLFKIVDKIFVVEPHLHRIKNIKKIFPYGEKINISNDIARYIKKLELKKPLIIGPDIESFQWVKDVAKKLNFDYDILKKIRYSSRKVKIKPLKINDLKNRDIIIIDDIISTGHTMLETIKYLKKLKPKKIYCIGIHGIFAENALIKLKKHSIVISTNTIPSKVSKIDISETISNKIK